MKWYKHDANASSDAKLRRVRLKYGMEGYGLYWYCLELVAQNVEAHNLTFELEHDAEIIAADTGIHYELVQEMMTFMVDLGLFEQRRGVITCLKMLKRLDQSMTSNPQMRDLIKKAKENHDSIMTNPDLVMLEENRLDENRLEETRTDYRAAKRVPKKWSPSDGCYDFALETGMNEAECIEQLAQFRDHEFKTARKDWDACWRTWCRNWKKWSKEQSTSTDPYYENLRKGLANASD